jgi:uncharacterized protein (DUF983 family)
MQVACQVGCMWTNTPSECPVWTVIYVGLLNLSLYNIYLIKQIKFFNINLLNSY